MSAKTSLRVALSAIDDAIKSLELARRHAKENTHDIRKAVKELTDAEFEIKRALRQIPEQEEEPTPR